MRGRRLSPELIAGGLGGFPPTPEQSAVIAAPLAPMLVVAGAGAGKTETMAARVVWLVANGLADPERVLGLTFTRKAAQQLGRRVRSRLQRLAGSELIRRADPDGSFRRRLWEAEPTVSTYHSYAGRILEEYGLLLPVDPGAVLLSETELWQLAFRVVTTWDGALDVDHGPAAVTESLLALAGEMAEHLVEPGDIEDAAADFEFAVGSLPPGPGQRKPVPKDLTRMVEKQRERLRLLPLLRRLHEVMREEGALDFGAQMSLAAKLARDHPEVGAKERERYRVVLLDEYQDTGHSQRMLLAGLFGRGAAPMPAVTAVGDPMQSIYGWRGASAANLPRFATDFPLPDGSPAPTRELLTSWRNPPEVLALANLVSAELREPRAGVPGVSTLEPRPDAGAGEIRLALHEDVVAERVWVADAIAEAWDSAAAGGGKPPTTAVLVRRNADAAPIAALLGDRGIPVEIVGVGGLLDVPEVTDVVSMLRAAVDPTAGGAMMRLLTGARLRLGAADIQALWNRARVLSIRRTQAGARRITDAATLEAALDEALPDDAMDSAGLADAVDDPGDPGIFGYSGEGIRRIRMLAADLRAVRRRLGQPLPELIASVEEILGIGVECMARMLPGGPGGGREHLDAFAAVVAGYAARSSPTLTGLLAYLDAAHGVEKGLRPGEVVVAEDRVQILTVHSAKGLEWEFVAVPHVVKGLFPKESTPSTWLSAIEQLPSHLRGDRTLEGALGFPVLDLEDLLDRSELEDRIAGFRKVVRERSVDEDRRLFYVALTRTERTLLVSGHHWEEKNRKPKGPSPFLTEIHAACTEGEDPIPARVDTWVAEPTATENPFADDPATGIWPADPLGARRPRVESGADLVRAALADTVDPPGGATPGGRATEWSAEVEVLLAERERLSRREIEVALPRRLTAGDMVALEQDPVAFARRLRRPLPTAPRPTARRGTAFHAWLEQRFGADRLLSYDELPGAADEGTPAVVDSVRLGELRDAFLASPWALRDPVEVEVPFETLVGGAVIRGRIDAVFRDPDGGWTVVDWKTGALPPPSERAALAMQLAVYRIAWARLAETTPDRVRARFWYVLPGVALDPADLPDADGLAAVLAEATGDDREGLSWRSDPGEPHPRALSDEVGGE